MARRAAPRGSLHRDGHEFPAEISLNPLATPSGVLFSSAIRDIGQRKAIREIRLRRPKRRSVASRTVICWASRSTATSWSTSQEIRSN